MSGRMMRTFKHAGKKAVKFRFTATIEKLIVEGTRSWQPYKLAVVWTRRKRRKTTTSRSWRPGIENPYKGLVEWSKLNPEVLQIEVTLFKNERRGQYESKDWVFVLENETQNGRRKAIATARVDMTNHVNDIPTPKQLNIKFKSLTAKLSSALLSITIRCEFLKEGDPMDSDMRSVAGSTASADTIGLAGVDVCDMTEFDDEDLDNLSRHSGSLNSRGSSTKHQISELTQQIEMLSKGFQNDVELPDGQQSILLVKNRQTSVSSYRSDRASIASSKSSRDTRESGSDQGKDKGDARKTSSDSEEPFENSPEQRRRLRPSIDVVPFVESDKTSHQALSISYSSPATETQKPLLLWCQQVTDGYRGVKLTNFSTSWRNGLAFCAILHRLNPESVDYANLKPLDGWDNLKKAFQGFKEVGFDTEEIYKAMRNNSGGVATKNIIISFLTKVKEYFEKHNLNDIITMLKTEKRNHELQPPQQLILPKLENNVHYLRGPNLADFMREKLLSDLEEKEGEDDVFSCELDEVLDSCNSDGSGQSVSQSATHVQSLGSSHTMSEDTFNKRELAATEDSLARDLLIDMKESFSPCKTEISETTETAETTVFQSPSSTQHIQTTKDNLSQSTSTSQSLNNRPLAPESQQIKMTSGEDNMVSVNESPSESFDDKDTLEIMETSAHVVLPSTIYDSKVSSGIEDDLRVNQGKSEKLSEQSEESPVSERRKRSLALIEKFKVDTLKRYGDSSPAKSVDSKRQKEIQEKAKRLLEETRVSLDLKPSVITHSTEALNYGYPESLSDSPTFNSKYHESKYATLPSRKAFRQEELFIESDDEQLHDGLQSFNAATEKLILGLSSDQVLDERLPPQAGAVLLPISDEELAPSSAKHRNSQKSNHKSNLSDQILLIDDEPCKSKIVKDKPTLEFSSKYVKPTSSDYNGNSCENQDSEYLMISQGIDGTDDDSIKKTPTDNIDRLLDNFFTEKIHEVPEPKHDFQNDIDHSVSSTPNSIAGEKSLAIERDDDDSVVPPLDRKEWTPKITKIPHSPQVSLLQTESLPNSHYSPARDPDIQRLPEKNGKLSTSSTKVPQSNDPITSTPVIPASSVNYKNVVEQPDKTSSKSTTSPIRLRTVNPVNIPEMESFSPIVPTAEGKIKPEQIRSKPVSKRLSHRKSSTSSLRQSIAKNDTGQLEHERMLLEEEMRTIDDRATEVQEELQELKKIGHRKGKQREEILMQEWIQLVQKRHAINRQQDQLLLLEQERDLQKQVDEINEQMRPFMEVQEHLKTEEQKEKEKGLLDQLICLVNERDRLIRTVDENEQNALEDDMHVQTNLDQNMSKVFNQEEEKCAIM